MLDHDETDATDDTVVRARRASSSSGTPAPEQSQAAGVEDAGVEDTVIRPLRVPQPVEDPFGDTVLRPAVRPTSRATSRPDDQAVPSVGPDTRLLAGPRLPADPRGAGPDRPAGPPEPAEPALPAARVPSVRIAGRVVRLDHPVVVGRRPGPPRIQRGPTPELVTVPSPSGQVSSSHVLLHAEGGVAVVDDLRSTNGTVVRPPGAAPFRMPAGASNVVLTGTVVEIGDGNVIEVLSAHLRVAPPPGMPDLPPHGRPTHQPAPPDPESDPRT